ncbi:FMN-linked oxidoreductase [Irpex rosettiformis]|uniref:FMN-linked oxidoreductase n=1 Tax=Irpex rosettiformis TaxID=378272 RepID=A0ACB8TWZ5_9APHY|nr:FMN-linked oxidoreductase [Irpex rosettiformis]
MKRNALMSAHLTRTPHHVFPSSLQPYHNNNHVPITKLVAEHYAQRAAVRGTLLIAEGTIVSPQAGGLLNVPGIWSMEQIAAWKEVVNAVHERGSFIYSQVFAVGRVAIPEVLEKEGPYPLVAPSDTLPPGASIRPRPLTIEEIQQYVEDFATAASNAVHGAGFDGVEIHGAHGGLVDQFIQDVTNHRTDRYGGSVENRARFVLEIVDAIVEKSGAERTSVRFSPWSHFQDMGMKDPVPTYSYIVEKIKERHPTLAFVHVVEPRVDAYIDRPPLENESNDFIRKIWQPRPLISAGGYNRELALEAADKKGDIIAFGRQYISNPDLPLRLKKNLPLTKYDRNKFYNAEDPDGYINYAYSPENEAELGKIPLLAFQ